MTTATALLHDGAELAEALLAAALPPTNEPPRRLHEAMRHVLLGGGKRIRPALVLGACRTCGGSDIAAAPAMTAVELLHSYTLVHDDLPAMDDDDLRRGRPTCHVAYGEATAILVGDALQALAFEQLAPLGGEAVAVLARAAGSRGVVGGQQMDLDAEGLPLPGGAAGAEALERIHRGKTAALIAASCELGAIAAGATCDLRQRLASFGQAIGLAFQVADDLLDCTASAAELGKTPGKDAAAGKWTWVAIHGVEGCQQALADLHREALQALDGLPEAAPLAELATFIVERRS